MRKKFAREYVKSGGKAKASAIKAGYSEKGAGQAANQLLNTPEIQNEIGKVFERAGLSIDEVAEIHKRNMLQDKHLPTSQRAVTDYYDITGMSKRNDEKGMQVAFIISDN